MLTQLENEDSRIWTQDYLISTNRRLKGEGNSSSRHRRAICGLRGRGCPLVLSTAKDGLGKPQPAPACVCRVLISFSQVISGGSLSPSVPLPNVVTPSFNMKWKNMWLSKSDPPRSCYLSWLLYMHLNWSDTDIIIKVTWAKQSTLKFYLNSFSYELHSPLFIYNKIAHLCIWYHRWVVL